jgi:hypothetical protein
MMRSAKLSVGKRTDLLDRIQGALRLASPIRKIREYLNVCRFYWYHKYVFGVTNTKFDITYTVFRESFLGDHYNIRRFLDNIGSSDEICFIDIGRNHGFVFYYTMYHIMRTQFPVSIINYYGIEPAPLKFVYFNFHDYLSQRGIRINYNIIDRAVVFNQEPSVVLKYGENNFGNFNVSGSNYAEKMASKQSRFEYVELVVETIQLPEIIRIIESNVNRNAIIVKIDCKNRTDYMFMEILDMLSKRKVNYLISCEQDGSSGRDVSVYVKKGHRVLSASNTIQD